jgi:hypothetical protein
MSTPGTARENISDVMQQFGEGSLPDLRETVRRVESVKTVRFAFHPWLPMPNFGSDGFRFNIPYPTLERLSLIPLAVFDYPRIVARPAGAFALSIATLTEAVPAMGSQSKVETLMQMPSTSMRDLYTAFSKFGMVELQSLVAHDEAELSRSYILFNAVMGAAQDNSEIEAGRRPSDLVLEEFPHWLAQDAPRALRAGLKRVVIRGRQYKLTEDQLPAGEKLITEISGSVARAEAAALNPSDGILPRTKELLNITANKGQGGKTHLDRQDVWLLEQYPSFKMDTDVERAQKAMQEAIVAGNQGSDDFKNGVMAILQQQQQAMNQQQETIGLLTQLIAGKQGEKAAQPAKAPTRPSPPQGEGGKFVSPDPNKRPQ